MAAVPSALSFYMLYKTMMACIFDRTGMTQGAYGSDNPAQMVADTECETWPYINVRKKRVRQWGERLSPRSQGRPANESGKRG